MGKNISAFSGRKDFLEYYLTKKKKIVEAETMTIHMFSDVQDQFMRWMSGAGRPQNRKASLDELIGLHKRTFVLVASSGSSFITGYFHHVVNALLFRPYRFEDFGGSNKIHSGSDTEKVQKLSTNLGFPNPVAKECATIEQDLSSR